MVVTIKIPHDKIKDPKKIDRVVEREFAAKGLKPSVHEVNSLGDNFRTGVRELQIKNTKYFFQGGR